MSEAFIICHALPELNHGASFLELASHCERQIHRFVCGSDAFKVANMFQMKDAIVDNGAESYHTHVRITGRREYCLTIIILSSSISVYLPSQI